jgi:hypothetical protein
MFSPPEMITSERRLGGPVIGEVAGHHVVAAHEDLAHRRAVARHVPHVLVDHAHEVRGRIALAVAGEEAGALLRGQVLPAVLPRAHRVRAVRLGQPVHVHDPDVERLHAPVQRRRRRRCGDHRGHALLERAGVRMVEELGLDHLAERVQVRPR